MRRKSRRVTRARRVECALTPSLSSAPPLRSFGFMPVVSMDKKMNKFTDWTIEKKKYWKPVHNVTRRVFRLGPLGHSKDSDEALFELELRRRTLTQDGVVDNRGKMVGGKDLKKVNAEWDQKHIRDPPELGSTEGADRDGRGGELGSGWQLEKGVGKQQDYARSTEHRRSFSQPPEDIARLMKEDFKFKHSGSPKVVDGGKEGEETPAVFGKFGEAMKRKLTGDGADNGDGEERGNVEEKRNILGGDQTDDEELSIVGEDDEAGIGEAQQDDERAQQRTGAVRKRTVSR